MAIGWLFWFHIASTASPWSQLPGQHTPRCYDVYIYITLFLSFIVH